MSSYDRDFVSLALDGEVMMDEIDDYVDSWHTTQDNRTLHEYLGMNQEEYALWLTSPDSLALILRRPLYEVANDNLQLMRLAARSNSKSDMNRLAQWLRNRHVLQ